MAIENNKPSSHKKPQATPSKEKGLPLEQPKPQPEKEKPKEGKGLFDRKVKKQELWEPGKRIIE